MTWHLIFRWINQVWVRQKSSPLRSNRSHAHVYTNTEVYEKSYFFLFNHRIETRSTLGRFTWTWIDSSQSLTPRDPVYSWLTSPKSIVVLTIIGISTQWRINDQIIHQLYIIIILLILENMHPVFFYFFSFNLCLHYMHEIFTK